LAGKVLGGLADFRWVGGRAATGAGAWGHGVQAALVEGLDDGPHRLDVQAQGIGDARTPPALLGQQQHAGVAIAHHVITALPVAQHVSLFSADRPDSYRHNADSVALATEKSTSVM
jgi:hypothetical protein